LCTDPSATAGTRGVRFGRGMCKTERVADGGHWQRWGWRKKRAQGLVFRSLYVGLGKVVEGESGLNSPCYYHGLFCTSRADAGVRRVLVSWGSKKRKAETFSHYHIS
jgi:hypothetical protein